MNRPFGMKKNYRIHKLSILERLKQEKTQQNTAEQTVTQKTAKKKHEQEL